MWTALLHLEWQFCREQIRDPGLSAAELPTELKSINDSTTRVGKLSPMYELANWTILAERWLDGQLVDDLYSHDGSAENNSSSGAGVGSPLHRIAGR